MTSPAQLSKEEINFTRFFLLNFKVAPGIARRFFDGIFPPANLSQVINNDMRAIINLNKSKRINAAQLEILRSVPGTVWPSYLPPMTMRTKSTSSHDFDLILMICLLRNLGGLATPINGWDQLPHPKETLPGADLATLKWYRNDLAHATVTCMVSNEFTDKWTQVEKALTALNKGQKPYEVIEIWNYDLDGEQANILANAELKQLKKEYLDCKTEKEQIENDFATYRDGNLPKHIFTKEEFNFTKLGMIVLNILTDALYDLLKQDRSNLRPSCDCDITYLYSEHRKLNKHVPSNSNHRSCPPGPWGGTWQDMHNTDIAIGDDIERIRLTRNELQHSRAFTLDDTRFNDLCNIIGHLLRRFDQNIKPVCLYSDRLNEILAKTFSEKEGI